MSQRKSKLNLQSNFKFSLLTIYVLTVFSISMASISPARADAPEPKGFKFEPIHGEDWPETGESDGGNRTSTEDDGEGEGRAPASTGMPGMKMNPDGTVDPESFKKFF